MGERLSKEEMDQMDERIKQQKIDAWQKVIDSLEDLMMKGKSSDTMRKEDSKRFYSAVFGYTCYNKRGDRFSSEGFERFFNIFLSNPENIPDVHLLKRNEDRTKHCYRIAPVPAGKNVFQHYQTDLPQISVEQKGKNLSFLNFVDRLKPLNDKNRPAHKLKNICNLWSDFQTVKKRISTIPQMHQDTLYKFFDFLDFQFIKEFEQVITSVELTDDEEEVINWWEGGTPKADYVSYNENAIANENTKQRVYNSPPVSATEGGKPIVSQSLWARILFLRGRLTRKKKSQLISK